MRRNDQSLESEHDVDLVVDHFEEKRNFNPTFYYELLRDQLGK